MKKKIILYLIMLLIIPISLCVFFSINKPHNTNDDIVIYESNNAEKVNVESLSDTKYTYSVIFVSLFLMGGLYLFVARRKE